MKNVTIALVTSALIFGSSFAMAEEEKSFEISANVALASGYLFYGASQTAGGTNESSGAPAISGGFDVAAPWDIFGGQAYAGTWASSVEWGGGTNQNEASIELDYYGGVAGDSIFNTGLSWDVGIWAYTYPNQDGEGVEDYDYIEYYFNTGYTIETLPLSPSLSVGVYYSPDYFGTTAESTHVPFGLDLALPYDVGLNIGGGYLTVDYATTDIDYTYYGAGLSKTVFGVDLSASWTGISEGGDCAAIQGTNCGGWQVGISKAF
jgi:uncharacterized protein (TIGR02001 family)